MEEWQKHIRRTHADKANESWCGVRLYSYDWAFTDIDHALHSIEQGTRILPCPACLMKIHGLVASVLQDSSSPKVGDSESAGSPESSSS